MISLHVWGQTCWTCCPEEEEVRREPPNTCRLWWRWWNKKPSDPAGRQLNCKTAKLPGDQGCRRSSRGFPGWGNGRVPPIWHQPSLEPGGSVSVADRKFSASNFDREFNWRHLAATSIDQVNVRVACQNRVSLSEGRTKPSWTLFLPDHESPTHPTVLPGALCSSGANSGSHHRLTGSCLRGGDTWVTDPRVRRGRRQTGRHVGYTVTRARSVGVHDRHARACTRSRSLKYKSHQITLTAQVFNNSLDKHYSSCACSLQQRQWCADLAEYRVGSWKQAQLQTAEMQ